MIDILIRQKECSKIDHSKAEDLADKELEGFDDYVEDPIDDLKERGRIESVRDQFSDQGSLLKCIDQAVITDDAP